MRRGKFEDISAEFRIIISLLLFVGELCLISPLAAGADDEVKAESGKSDAARIMGRRVVIEGTIFDDTTGEAIPYVTVQIPASGLATKTIDFPVA